MSKNICQDHDMTYPSDELVEEVKKIIKQRKSEGFKKTEVNGLSWNDPVVVLNNKLEFINGKVCKLVHGEKYILIINDKKEFKRIYYNTICRLYFKKYMKVKKEKKPRTYIESDSSVDSGMEKD